MKTVDITPSVRGRVYDDPEFKIGLVMSLGFAQLLHEILEDGRYGSEAAAIDSCLTQAIKLAKNKNRPRGSSPCGETPCLKPSL